MDHGGWPCNRKMSKIENFMKYSRWWGIKQWFSMNFLVEKWIWNDRELVNHGGLSRNRKITKIENLMKYWRWWGLKQSFSLSFLRLREFHWLWRLICSGAVSVLLCILLCISGGTALRVHPVVTRLTVYRRLHVTRRAVLPKSNTGTGPFGQSGLQRQCNLFTTLS